MQVLQEHQEHQVLVELKVLLEQMVHHKLVVHQELQVLLVQVVL